MRAALAARQLRGPEHGVSGRGYVAGRDQEARHPIEDHLAECAAPERHDRRPARLSLGGDHPEWLIPAHGAEHDGGARHHLPERHPRNAGTHEDAWLGAVRLDPSAGVFVVVAITKELDPDARGSRDLDRLGRSFLGAEPAGEDSAVPRCGRSEEHTSELQSPYDLVCRLLLEKTKEQKQSSLHSKKKTQNNKKQNQKQRQ